MSSAEPIRRGAFVKGAFVQGGGGDIGILKDFLVTLLVRKFFFNLLISILEKKISSQQKLLL